MVYGTFNGYWTRIGKAARITRQGYEGVDNGRDNRHEQTVGACGELEARNIALTEPQNGALGVAKGRTWLR